MVFSGVVDVLGVRGPGFGSVQPISSIANKHDTASKAEKNPSYFHRRFSCITCQNIHQNGYKMSDPASVRLYRAARG